MTPPPLRILFQDNHCIAVYKPPGLLTQSDQSREPSLLEQVRDWIKSEHGKPGNVYLGMVHRLDRPVAGAVLFAKTSKAASRLSEQIRERKAGKFYRAVVEGTPDPPASELVHYLCKQRSLKATVFPREAPDAKRAELSYRVLESAGGRSELEILLKTGRFHQIRAQLGFIGHPVVGDVKYGAQDPLPEGRIALYAQKLIFRHPVTKENLTIESPPPPEWAEYLRG